MDRFMASWEGDPSGCTCRSISAMGGSVLSQEEATARTNLHLQKVDRPRLVPFFSQEEAGGAARRRSRAGGRLGKNSNFGWRRNSVLWEERE
jgi:hypothetical protein